MLFSYLCLSPLFYLCIPKLPLLFLFSLIFLSFPLLIFCFLPVIPSFSSSPPSIFLYSFFLASISLYLLFFFFATTLSHQSLYPNFFLLLKSVSYHRFLYYSFQCIAFSFIVSPFWFSACLISSVASLYFSIASLF